MTDQANTCGTCKFYNPEDGIKGTCHRYPPQRGLQAVEVTTGIDEFPPTISLIPDCHFPLTQAVLWCGEYVKNPRWVPINPNTGAHHGDEKEVDSKGRIQE